MPSLLELSSKELQEEFGEDLTRHELCRNAKKYKQEVLDLFFNNEWQKLRSILKQFFAIESHLHKWKIWEAFWDNKWAKYQYRQIQKWEESYDEAQYHLLNLEVQNYSIDSSSLGRARLYLENIERETKWYSKWCHFLSEIYCLKWEYQKSLEYLLEIKDNQISCGTRLSQNISDISRKLKKVSLDGGRLEFEKGNQYYLVPIFIEWIDSIFRASWNYVVSLYNDEHENPYQEGKFMFYCADFDHLNDPDDPEFWDGIYSELEELDDYIKQECVIFEWVKDGELVFRRIWVSKKQRESNVMSNNWVYTVNLNQANSSVREKRNDYLGSNDSETYPVLAWQNEGYEIIMITNRNQDGLENLYNSL